MSTAAPRDGVSRVTDGGGHDGMHTTYRIIADNPMTARQVAANRARAEGWGHVIVFDVRRVGTRDFDVEVVVSQLRR